MAEPGAGAGAGGGQTKLTEFENVLVQLTLTLHRALVRELTQAYRERMIDSALRGMEQEPTRRAMDECVS